MKLTLLAWCVFVLAVLAWVGVAAFASHLSDVESTWQEARTQVQSASVQSAMTQRTHVLAQATATDRAALDMLLNTDVVALAKEVQKTGDPAGVKLALGGAVSGAADQSGIGTVTFAVQGDGTFTQLAKTELLLESLPLPSQVVALDINRADATAKAPWHLSAEIRVLTVNPSP